MTFSVLEMAQIRSHAEGALAMAKDTKGGHCGGVNWSNLKVTDVVFCKNEDGREWYRVDIEEANSDDLAVFVSDYLYTAGYPKVEVNTEW